MKRMREGALTPENTPTQPPSPSRLVSLRTQQKGQRGCLLTAPSNPSDQAVPSGVPANVAYPGPVPVVHGDGTITTDIEVKR